MDFNISNFDLFMLAAGVITYATGSAVWVCLKAPALLWREPAMKQALKQAANSPFQLENINEFL